MAGRELARALRGRSSFFASGELQLWNGCLPLGLQTRETCSIHPVPTQNAPALAASEVPLSSLAQKAPVPVPGPLPVPLDRSSVRPFLGFAPRLLSLRTRANALSQFSYPRGRCVLDPSLAAGADAHGRASSWQDDLWGLGPFSSASYLSAVAVASAVAAVTAAASMTAAAKALPQKPIPDEFVLYQYEACPFCNKVKAYLDYYSIPYKVVEVNPLTRKEIKEFAPYKKVPVLVVNGEPLKDSSVIISTLQDRLNPPPTKITRDILEQKEEETKWRKWVDDHLVHLLSPNIYRTSNEALEAFDYITTNGNFGYLERVATRYVGASTMYFIGKKLKKKYNIEDEREGLYSALREWTTALGKRKFMGGAKPNLADLAVFGVLRPIRNLRTGKDMMEHTDIGRWYNDMVSEVGETSRLPENA